MADTAFHRLKQVLLTALDLAPSERSAFLGDACSGDTKLRSRARALLASVENEPALLQTMSLDELIRRSPDVGELATMAMTSPTLPARIGCYPILAKLGEGGMGVVYLARDPSLEREIAVKILPRSFSAHAGQVTRFRREAKMLATVNHPSITTVYSIEESDRDLFITMEYVPGHTLAERIAGAPLALTDTLRFCRQIAAALEASHKKGVIHRDLKPLNVKVTPEGEVKVLDFGIAKAVAAGMDLTHTGEALGTPGYMSPEQLRGQECDQRADIWSFGCLLYACLTGRSPFQGQTPAEAVAATLEREPAIDALPGDTPPPLRDLVAGCLTKPINGRLGEMCQVRQALDGLIAGTGHRERAPRREGALTPHNLRHALTGIIGRDDELSEVSALLADHPLVTLTGVGGCGKTRVALETGWGGLDAFSDGVWFVRLAPISDPDLVPATVMGALALKEASGTSPTDILISHAKNRKLLLILDNCEHLIRATARFAKRVLETCPSVRILATSREELGIDGERVYSVPPLATPTQVGGAGPVDIEASPAVQLFLERARSVRPSLEVTEANASSIAEIVRRLDGIPLALELAAARTRVLSIEDLSRRLDRRFETLTAGRNAAVPRHRTLWDLIEWSYELLEENERAVLRRLSMFAGGWTLDAAESVCKGQTIEAWEVLDLFTRLVEKSLVEREPEGSHESGEIRFRMLEMVREYARHRLEESGEAAEAGERHRAYFLALAEEAAPELAGPDLDRWLRRLRSDHDNLCLAGESADGDGSGEQGLRLAGALLRYWASSGHWSVGRAACERALERAGGSVPALVRARTMYGAGFLAWRLGDTSTAVARYEESLSIYRELDDRQNVAYMVACLANVARSRGDYSTARVRLEESLSVLREIGDQLGVATALRDLSLVVKGLSDFPAAREYGEEALAIWREHGHRDGVALALTQLGSVARLQGDHATAEAQYKESLAISREVGDHAAMASALGSLGSLAESGEDHVRARTYMEECLGIFEALGNPRGVANARIVLGDIARAEGDIAAASAHLDRSLTIFRELESQPGIAAALRSLGNLADAEGKWEIARDRLQESLSILREIGDERAAGVLLGDLGRVALHQDDGGGARESFGGSFSIHLKLGSLGDLATSLEAIGLLAASVDQPVRAARLLGAAQAFVAAPAEESASRLEGALDATTAALRGALGNRTFQVEWEAGSGLSCHEAADLAIETLELGIGRSRSANPKSP